jgi:hypothetical protein
VDAYQGWHSGRTGERRTSRAVTSGIAAPVGAASERRFCLASASGARRVVAASRPPPPAPLRPAQRPRRSPLRPRPQTRRLPPSKEPAKPAGIDEGEWLVGAEVEPGRYRSTGAKEGIFDLCSATTRSDSGDVIEWKTGKTGEQVLINVTGGAARFSHSGCEPFVKVG